MQVNTIRILALLAMLTLPGQASAATTMAFTPWQPTPGLPGYYTTAVTATSSAGGIIGFNFVAGGAENYGIFGTLSQVNPFGLATVFDDIADAAWDATVGGKAADTHFLVKSADGITVGSSESTTALHGAFNFSNAVGAVDVLPFVQFVGAAGSGGRIVGQFTIKTPSGQNILENVDAGFWVAPEPTSGAIAACAAVALAAKRRRRT